MVVKVDEAKKANGVAYTETWYLDNISSVKFYTLPTDGEVNMPIMEVYKRSNNTIDGVEPLKYAMGQNQQNVTLMTDTGYIIEKFGYEAVSEGCVVQDVNESPIMKSK
jgi:hypothetical protein